MSSQNGTLSNLLCTEIDPNVHHINTSEKTLWRGKKLVAPKEYLSTLLLYGRTFREFCIYYLRMDSLQNYRENIAKKISNIFQLFFQSFITGSFCRRVACVLCSTCSIQRQLEVLPVFRMIGWSSPTGQLHIQYRPLCKRLLKRRPSLKTTIRQVGIYFHTSPYSRGRLVSDRCSTQTIFVSVNNMPPIVSFMKPREQPALSNIRKVG